MYLAQMYPLYVSMVSHAVVVVGCVVRPSFSFPGKLDSGIAKVCEEVHVALAPFYLYNIQFGIFSYLNKQINRWHPK